MRALTRRFVCSLAAILLPCAAFARPITSPPPLPAPQGTVVTVSTEAQLQTAVKQIASNTTIVIAPGTYRLSSTLYINGSFSNVGIRGATNNRDDVVLVGPGMTNANYGAVPFGIWTGGNVQGVTIANLTIRDLYEHPIIFNGGTQSPRVYNVHLINAGQQFIKSNPNSSGVGAGNGDVEYSILEYVTTAPSGYTNAVDIHGGANWTIRNNLFRNIVGPPGQLAGPAILAWNHSSNTLTEGNTFLNCGRGIAYGLQDVSGSDHSGGIIRNNFFYRSSSQPGDVGIYVADSPNTQVVNNTVLMSGTYPNAIEYRFTGTTGTLIENNLLDAAVSARDGATGTSKNNLTNAAASMFVNAAAGDLHLVASATAAIDHGIALSSVTDDWDGDPRPFGSAPDIGADEYVGTSTPAPGPVVSLSAPANGATFTSPNAITVTATASSAVGINRVAFYAGTTLIGTDAQSPYSLTWNVSTPGSYSLTAVATDSNGATTTSSVHTITVSAPATVSVTLTAPSSGTGYTAPATIALSASASTSTGTISKVDFYNGSTLLGTDTVAPFSFNWSNVAAGSYTLSAKATNSDGTTLTSSPATISVTNAPTPIVSVSLTSPTSGATYTAPASISLAANASTSSGTIAKVDFYNGSTLIGTDTTAPFTGNWSGVQAGTYALSAKATDSNGIVATSGVVNVTVSAGTPAPSGGWLLQSSNLVPIGTFRLPQSNLGSQYGFSYAGDQGNGAYGVTFNPANNSLFIGGHPYEQKMAEIKIPASFTGNPVATALQNLLDPLEGHINSINPSDPNKKSIGGALVYNGKLLVSAFSGYDGGGTQNASAFVRPLSLSTTGQLVGPVKVGSTYPGWVDRSASLVPTEWQSVLGGTALFGGGSGSINALQSWGPSASVLDAANVGVQNPVPATQLVGYPYPNHELGPSPTAANTLWSQMDLVTGLLFVPGTHSVLFFGRHGTGAYCYGPVPMTNGKPDPSRVGQPATDIGDTVDKYCWDPTFTSKGGHSYPYVSYVWAFDANDLAAVKAGTKNYYDVRPYAVWQLDPAYSEVQGVAYDPATQHLFVSQVGGDPYNGGQPLIHVYQVQ